MSRHDEAIKEHFEKGLDDYAIAKAIGASKSTVYMRRRVMRLLRKNGRPPNGSTSSGKDTRHRSPPLLGKPASMPAYSDPRYVEHLEAIKEAVRMDEFHRFMRSAADAKIEAWRTQSSNTKGKNMTSLRGKQRQEFSQAVRKAAFIRCCINGTKPGIPQCENCGNDLVAGNIEYEHINPDGLGGAPTLENCGVWCKRPCSFLKTHREDNPRMSKADRVLKKTFGLMPPKRKKIQSRGFEKARPQHSASRPLEKRIP